MKFVRETQPEPAIDYSEVRAYIDVDGDLRLHPDMTAYGDTDNTAWISAEGLVFPGVASQDANYASYGVCWWPQSQTDRAKLFFAGDRLTFEL